LTAGKAVIHCDDDPASIGRFGPVDAGVVGDARACADTIVEWLDAADVEPSTHRSAALADRLEALDPTADFDDVSTDETIDLRRLTCALDAIVPADRTVVFDIGRYMLEAIKRIHVAGPPDFIITSNFAAIGLGTATAVGAAVGRPDRVTLAMVGDGGFMMGGLAEFNTAVRHGLDLILVVFNDGSYGAEFTLLKNRGLDRTLSLFDWPDLAPVAVALGGDGCTVRSPADLDSLEAAITNRTRPLLIDVKLDPASVLDVPH
jgi:thiamine pyrophosphate-dependent acetolactate synthase large subunit-like protein